MTSIGNLDRIGRNSGRTVGYKWRLGKYPSNSVHTRCSASKDTQLPRYILSTRGVLYASHRIVPTGFGAGSEMEEVDPSSNTTVITATEGPHPPLPLANMNFSRSTLQNRLPLSVQVLTRYLQYSYP